MKILIITGGVSSERKISLISARMVKDALLANRHHVAMFDFKKGYTQLEKILPQFDVVFPVMHGKEGEDGVLYKFLSSRKKSFVGSNPKGAKIAFDKILFKKYCLSKNIPTAKWKGVSTLHSVLRFGFPCVLKGAHGGSSHEVFLLHTEKHLSQKKVMGAFQLQNKFFAEELLTGTEVTVGILLGKALPVMEVVPPENSWFNYKNKYSGATKEIAFAPSVSPRLQKLMQKIALQVHNDLNLGSFSRTDIIVRDGVPYVLEVNTPGGVGLTPESLLPKAAKAVGISFEQLVEKMIEGRFL